MKSITFVLLLFSINALGQTELKQLHVYFAFDQFVLTETERVKIDALMATEKEIEKIELYGHTDNSGEEDYNLKLAEKRGNAIQTYLQQKGISASQIKIKSFGENSPIQSNDTDRGRQENRRVEVVLYLVKEKAKEEPFLLEQKKEKLVEIPKTNSTATTAAEVEKPKAESLTGDTVLLIGGVQIVISRVDFHKYKDCLTINPILDGTEAYRNNLTTMTVANEMLVSCGMINVELKEPCEGCFDQPIKVRFPVTSRECDVCKIKQVYNVSDDGRWTLQQGDKIRKIRIAGKFFYEMELTCPGRRNCDCKLNKKNIKFKLPKPFKLLHLNVVYHCPSANYRFEVKKNKAKGGLPCLLVDREAFVYLEAISPQNDTIKIEHLALNEWEHSRFKKCKKGRKENRFLIFKAWKHRIYSRYRLKNWN